MLLSLAEPAEPAEKDEIDLWPEFRDRRILATLHALRAEVFNNLHLYLLIIFMFSIASSFSVMLECLYRASMQFLSGNHYIFWIPACFDRLSNLREWQCCWAFCPLSSDLCPLASVFLHLTPFFRRLDVWKCRGVANPPTLCLFQPSSPLSVITYGLFHHE